MGVFRCKMCGAPLNTQIGLKIAECEYCGAKQSICHTDNDLINNLYQRANDLRLQCEFDRAEQVYERILEHDYKDAEAHWGIILCRYGIEYVQDPRTGLRIPTCHRASYQSITADPDYIAAIQHGTPEQKQLYTTEAATFNNLQKNILAIAKNERPFDVFLCYKETDNGKRTADSVLANDIYYQLVQENYKVFYAPITLEDKIGQAYEPYIFSALNTAKVMIVLGTKPEYFQSVWVRNEWSRYLGMIKNGSKQILIPAYRDMDPYNLPEEFSHLQALDMGRIGFIQDLIRGIRKVTAQSTPQEPRLEQQETNSGGTVSTLLKRAFMFLQDRNWQSADEYCEKVLDRDPECAEAYLAKLLSRLGVSKFKDLNNESVVLDEEPLYQKALRYASNDLKEKLIITRKDCIYNAACFHIEADTIEDCEEAIALLKKIPGWRDEAKLRVDCENQIKQLNTRRIVNLVGVAIAVIVVYLIVIIASG